MDDRIYFVSLPIQACDVNWWREAKPKIGYREAIDYSKGADVDPQTTIKDVFAGTALEPSFCIK